MSVLQKNPAGGHLKDINIFVSVVNKLSLWTGFSLTSICFELLFFSEVVFDVLYFSAYT